METEQARAGTQAILVTGSALSAETVQKLEALFADPDNTVTPFELGESSRRWVYVLIGNRLHLTKSVGTNVLRLVPNIDTVE